MYIIIIHLVKQGGLKTLCVHVFLFVWDYIIVCVCVCICWGCLRESKFVLTSERKIIIKCIKIYKWAHMKTTQFQCVHFSFFFFSSSTLTCKQSIYLIQHKMNVLITYTEWMRIKDEQNESKERGGVVET